MLGEQRLRGVFYAMILLAIGYFLVGWVNFYSITCAFRTIGNNLLCHCLISVFRFLVAKSYLIIMLTLVFILLHWLLVRRAPLPFLDVSISGGRAPTRLN